MERLVRIIFFSILALLPLLLAVAIFSFAGSKPLPSWARNWFLEKMGAPESWDRAIIAVIGLFFLFLTVMIALVGFLA